MSLPGFSPFAPRECDDVRISRKPKQDTSPGKPLLCASCSRKLYTAPGMHIVRGQWVCWPLCEDA